MNGSVSGDSCACRPRACACVSERGMPSTAWDPADMPDSTCTSNYGHACMTVSSVIQFHLHVLYVTIDFRALQMWQAGGKV